MSQNLAGTGLILAALVFPAAAADTQSTGAAPAAAVSRSQHRYTVPAVSLIGHDGRRVLLEEALPRDSAVALNFIYTRCGSACPMLTRAMASLRRQLRARADGLRVVSISIDPEHDTPEQLQAYATRYSAGGSWQFYTGEPGDIDEVLHAFDAAAPIKVDHRSITLVRAAYSDDWTRFEGAVTADQLAVELSRIKRRR